MDKKTLIIMQLFIVTALYGEVSVFGAGNLELDNPYGLNRNEKIIFDNKSKIKKLAKDNYRFENSVKSLENDITTLKSLVASVSKKNHDNQLNINAISKDIDELNSLSQQAKSSEQKNLGEIKKQQSSFLENKNKEFKLRFQEIDKIIKIQNSNIQKSQKKIEKTLDSIQSKINSLQKQIDKINKQYVTQKQLDLVVSEFNKFKETLFSELETIVKANKSEPYQFSKHSHNEIFKEGKRLISVGKYKDSIQFFNYLIEKHYRPATDHYYIGECYYFSGEYPNAISHYKESVSIYDQSRFMPNLLLHTGSAFEKIGDRKNAITFYEILSKKYIDTAEGAKAKKILLNLK